MWAEQRAGIGKKTWPTTMTLRKPTTYNLLAKADDWECAADLPGWNEYPEIIKKTEMRPDIILHSQNAKEVLLIELTVPYESRSEDAHAYN